jgi:hypothetical protein
MIELRGWPLDEAQQEQQDDGPDGRDNEAPDQTASGPNAQRAEDEASQQRSDYADYNVAQDAKPATFHHGCNSHFSRASGLTSKELGAVMASE